MPVCSMLGRVTDKKCVTDASDAFTCALLHYAWSCDRLDWQLHPTN